MNRCKVQEIAELITKGTTPTTLGFSYIDEGINFVKIESIDANGNFDKTKFAHISEECHVSLKRSKLQKNDILFSIAGAIGRTAIVSEDILPANTNQALAIIRLKKNNNDLNFIRYQLSSASVIKQTEKQKQGVAQLNLSLKDIGNLEINVPSLPEQQKIAAYLDSIQSAIDNKKQQLQQLDELVKSKFVEMFGNPVENEKNWETILLNNACDGIGDGLHGTPEYVDYSDFPFINGNNLDTNIIITPTTKFVSEETYKKHFIEISNNALLLSINGTLGKLAYYNSEKVMLGKSACYINLKVTINKYFVFGLMSSSYFLEFMENASTKSTIKNVGLKAIREFKLILPPIELQNTFAEYVQKIDSAKSIIKTQLVDLQELLDSKMDEYFGG